MLGHFGFGREVQIPLHYRVKNRFLSTLVHDDGGGGGLDHCGTVGWHGGGGNFSVGKILLVFPSEFCTGGDSCLLQGTPEIVG